MAKPPSTRRQPARFLPPTPPVDDDDWHGADDSDGADDDPTLANAAAVRRAQQGLRAALAGADDVAEYSAADYLAGARIALPSGKAIRVRPLSLLSMLHNGTLPKPLVQAARRALQFDTPKRGPRVPDEDEVQGATALIDFMVCQMVTSFPVVTTPQADCPPGTVSVASLFDADKTVIFMYAMQGQDALTDFRRVG